MLSSDHGTSISRRVGVRGIVLVLAAWALAACTIQPVYAPSGAAQTKTAQIVVQPVKERVAQQVRNGVVFGLTGGKPVNDPLYRMKLTVSSKEIGLGIDSVDASPVYSIQVAATYEVVEIASGRVVYRHTARASASYSRTNQAFANSRAKIDAENRAAATVADEITIRVATVAARTS